MSANQLNQNALGEVIRRYRKQKGMTQDALAQELNVTAQSVSKWETGQSMPDIGLLLPLSKALGVGVNELLGGDRRQELEKKFQATLPFGEELTLLVALEALEQYPDDETFLYRRACDELFLGERDLKERPHSIYYLSCAIPHFEQLHYKYPENETYTTMLVRAYRARGQMEEAEKLVKTLKDPGNRTAMLIGEEKRRYKQEQIRGDMRTLCAHLSEYNTPESLEAYRIITEAMLGEDVIYQSEYWLYYAKVAAQCREAGDTAGFVDALTKAYEFAKQYDGTKRGIKPCRAPLFDLLHNEVSVHGSVCAFLRSQMQLLEDSATDALKARIVSEQITYRPLLRHEWIEYYEFCKTYACGPTWSNYSTQYDYEIDYQNVMSNFRFRGYFDAQMNAYHRALVERLITEGIMTGYCAYAGNDILAYVNCKDKDRYFALGISEEERAVPTAPEGSKILAINDLLVAPAFKNSGVRENLLRHALVSAQRRGYTHAEAYLYEGVFADKADFEALLSVYEQAGFFVIRDLSKITGGLCIRNYILQKQIGDMGFAERATRFTFGDYVIEVDVEKTREVYTKLRPVNEKCKCDCCANYQKVVTSLPNNVHMFFWNLGVNLSMITESVACHRNRDGTVHYGGVCHVCGKVVKGKNMTVMQDGQLVTMRSEDAYEVADGVIVWFSDECNRVEREFDAPVMQLDFCVDLPWLTDKKFPEELSFIL
ncbi:MAG: helix-turn-helix domain-containing protein [Clostridia bacterium]|nr:helix-turn-helix domain-containing protein [Clostridia bacterium]